MRQTELHMTDEACSLVDEILSKGLHPAQEVNRPHVLPSLERGYRRPRSGRCREWGTRLFNIRARPIFKGVKR